MRRAIFLAAVAALAFAACNGEDCDMDKPAITTEGITASPSECDSYERGDTIRFCYRMTDNMELGNFNIEVHGNHDHHTHSTSDIECEHEGEEEHHNTENPWVFNQDYQIPDGLRDYTAHVDIAIPTDVDPGDYHFMIRLTDKAGWQEIRSVAIELE